MNPVIDIDALSRAEQDAILKKAAIGAGQAFPFRSLEELVASPEGFGLDAEGTMSDLQRALCRVLEGVPLRELARSKQLAKALNLKTEELLPYENKPFPKAKEFIVLAAVRTAKSLIAAAVAIWATQKLTIPAWIREGEIPRYSVASLELDNAKVILGHLAGALAKPALQSLRVPKKSEPLLTETGQEVVGAFFVYNRHGRILEIRIVAGKKAGGSLVSRWSLGCTFDEAPRMVGGSEAVINYTDSLRGVKSRLIPGAQVFSIGSPWQPSGPIYDRVEAHHGELPNDQRCIFRARGQDMNPVWWTEKRCAELRDSPNRDDQMTYQTDVLAEFADEEEMLFSQALLRSITRDNDDFLPYEKRKDYKAAMDPATRGNAWTLVIGSRSGRKLEDVYRKEWRPKPNQPLRPRVVLGEIAGILREYNLDWCYSDQWAADHNKDMALEEGFAIVDVAWTTEEITKSYTNLAHGMEDGFLELSNDPQVRADLKAVKKKPKHGGGYSISLPTTANGRHCDYAPAYARVFKQWIDDILPEEIKPGDARYTAMVEKAMEDADLAQFEKEQRGSEVDDDIFQTDPWDEWMQQRDVMAAAKRIIREST